jgi:hypothetical protein
MLSTKLMAKFSIHFEYSIHKKGIESVGSLPFITTVFKIYL